MEKTHSTETRYGSKKQKGTALLNQKGERISNISGIVDIATPDLLGEFVRKRDKPQYPLISANGRNRREKPNRQFGTNSLIQEQRPVYNNCSITTSEKYLGNSLRYQYKVGINCATESMQSRKSVWIDEIDAETVKRNKE